jgi:hypothetical protein
MANVLIYLVTVSLDLLVRISCELSFEFMSFKIGYGGSCAFAFPPYQLAYGYVCNQLNPIAITIDPRSIRVIQAIENILNNQNK